MKRTRFTLVVLAVVMACGKAAPKPGDSAGPGTPAGDSPNGAPALPAETRAALSVDLARAKSSPLLLGLLVQAQAGDPELGGKLQALFGRCKLDPLRDLERVTVVVGEGDDLALLARGGLDEATLSSCVKSDSVKVSSPRAHVYELQGVKGTKLWLAFGGERTALVATSEALATKILDPKTPRIDTRPEVAALVKRVDPKAVVWAFGLVPPALADPLAKAAQVPIVSASFELKLDGGLDATLSVDVKSDADATKLAAFARSQVDWLAVAAQRYRLGRVVSRTQIANAGKNVVTLRLKLEQAELAEIEASLSKPESPETPKKKEP